MNRHFKTKVQTLRFKEKERFTQINAVRQFNFISVPAKKKKKSVNINAKRSQVKNSAEHKRTTIQAQFYKQFWFDNEPLQVIQYFSYSLLCFLQIRHTRDRNFINLF